MEVRPGYKQTEAGLLPEDWEVAPLGGFVRITSGASPSQFRFSGSGIPYFKVEQLSNAEKYLDATDTPYRFECGDTVPGQSVMFAKRGAAIALNKVRILKQAAFMDTNLMSLTPQDGLECEYLYYALGHIGLWRFADTTSVPQINNKHVKPLPFPLPCPPEQHAIATALSDVDALLAGLDRLIVKKRGLKQAAMQQLLTGQTRLPGFYEDWEVKQLGECGRFCSGTYLAQDAYRDGEFEVQGAGSIMGKHAVANIPEAISVIGRVGTVGRPRFMPIGCWVNNNAAAIVALPGSATPQFVHLLLMTMDWSKATSVTAQPFLVVESLMKMEFHLPPVQEQTAIAAVLSDMDAEIEAFETRRDKTRDLKQAMMQELLTGKTRLVHVGGDHA